MAEWSACFDWDVAASAAENHYTSSGHGGIGQHFVHNDGGAPAGVVITPGARSRAFGGINEMDPTSFPGYGSSNVPMAIAAPARGPPRARSSGQQLRQFRGSWTVEEDMYVENPTLIANLFLCPSLAATSLVFFVILLQAAEGEGA